MRCEHRAAACTDRGGKAAAAHPCPRRGQSCPGADGLDTYLSDKVFAGEEGTTIAPDEKDVEGFDEFIKQYQKGLALERVAIDVM